MTALIKVGRTSLELIKATGDIRCCSSICGEYNVELGLPVPGGICHFKVNRAELNVQPAKYKRSYLFDKLVVQRFKWNEKLMKEVSQYVQSLYVTTRSGLNCHLFRALGTSWIRSAQDGNNLHVTNMTIIRGVIRAHAEVVELAITKRKVKRIHKVCALKRRQGERREEKARDS
jgi:hypothetical protein